MSTLPRRKTSVRSIPRRRPLNLHTLQMMVRSGVVRRADCNPPSFGSETRLHVFEDADRHAGKKMVSEQGWLSRIILGRQVQVSISKRS